MRQSILTPVILFLLCTFCLVSCSTQQSQPPTPFIPTSPSQSGSPVDTTTLNASPGVATVVPPTTPQTDGEIRIGVAGPARSIDPRIFGTNVPAWLNTDGLANPTFIQRAYAADLSVIRMPGGSWSNTYDWLGCEVERADPCTYAARPSDFLTLLHDLGVDGMWTVSFNGTAEEAAALVAFFNGDVDDERSIGVDPRGQDWKTVGEWARLRAASGHPAPVDLQLWEVGNEVYGGKSGTGKDCADWGWEEGWTCDGTEYVLGKGEGTERRQGFLEFREAMRTVDPDILVGAVGVPRQNDWGNWGNEVIAAAGQIMDFYIVHQYAFYDPPASIADALAEPQRTWREIASDVRAAFRRETGGREVPIAVTEYNLFSFQDNDTAKLMSSAVNMLHLADTLGQIAEQGIILANQWNLANGTTDSFGNYGMLDAGSLERYPQYYVFPLWSRFGHELLPVASSFDPRNDLSVYAGRTEEGAVSLMVINKTATARTAGIILEGATSITTGTVDIAQAESWQSMSVSFNGVREPSDNLSDAPSLPLNGLSKFFTYTFNPYSVTLLRLTAE